MFFQFIVSAFPFTSPLSLFLDSIEKFSQDWERKGVAKKIEIYSRLRKKGRGKKNWDLVITGKHKRNKFEMGTKFNDKWAHFYA